MYMYIYVRILLEFPLIIFCNFVAIVVNDCNCLIVLLLYDKNCPLYRLKFNILPIRLALCSVLQGYLLVSKLC